MPSAPGSQLLQRESEAARLEAAAARAAAGDGSLVLIDGPAGIGKSALLRRARAAAGAHGLHVLSAVASELDRAYPYGLVHQLLEAEIAGAGEREREELLSGAAAGAGVVFDLAGSPPAEPGHAVLHGLYWLCANLADSRPLALLVDDLHWADRASLRFLEYLSRRLEGVPLVLVVTTRVAEPGAEEDLLESLYAAGAMENLWLEPLAAEAAATLLAGWLGSTPDPAFLEAALAATGGTPLLLHGLGREARVRGVTGAAADAPRAQELAGSSMAAGVQRRLRSLGPEATVVAQAAAILGARRTAEDLASVAQLDLTAVRVSLDLLAPAGILVPGSGLEFAHPLVRSAVRSAASPSVVAGLHVRAAARLAEVDARADEQAVHLLGVPPAGDARVVETLRAAAAIAVAEGAGETAVLQLRRALQEPPAREQLAMVLLELGEAEQRTGAPEAMARLEAALGEGLAGDARARAHAARGAQLISTDPLASVAALEEAAAQADDPDLRLRLEAGLLDSTAYLASLAGRRETLLAAGRTDHPSVAMLAHLAMDHAYRGQPAAETLSLVERALEGGRLVRVVGPGSPTVHLLILALRHAERPDLAELLLTQGDLVLARYPSRLASMRSDHARALWNLQFGSVAAAEALARAALGAVEGQGMPLPELSARVALADVLVEQDRLAEVEPLLAAVPDTPLLDDVIVGPDLLSVRALARAAAGRRAEAVDDLRRAAAQLERRGWRAPLKARAGLRLAGLLADGSPVESRAIAERELASARAAQTPGAEGAALRALARAAGGAEGLALLREAVGVLAPSPLRLERGWALHDLGALLRREGQRVDSREPLREALAVAERCEAPLLLRQVREELDASGARPRREALSGVASLTPSERRVADLAAAGRTNREIAEALWVTRKTVEVHLGKAYGKLGIRTRAELPAALTGPS